MTTYTATHPSVARTVASQAEQFQAIHDALLGAGWVQTADTGQLGAWPSTYQSTTNTVVGYRIYKWSDSLSGTLGSLYAKVTFITDLHYYSGSQSVPCVKVDMSMSTDGAGNLTGASASIVQITGTSASGAGEAPGRRATYGSYSVANNYSISIISANNQTWQPSPGTSYTNKLFPTGYPPIANMNVMLAVRRLTNSAGAAQAGFSVVSSGTGCKASTYSADNTHSHKLNSARITASASAVWGSEMIMSFAQSGILVPVSLTPAVQLINPLVVSSDGALMPFQEMAWYYSDATFTLDQSFTNTIAGVDRTFRALGDCGVYPMIGDSRASQPLSENAWLDRDVRCRLSIRWE